MTKEWKNKYKGSRVKAICLLIIDHYKYVMLIDTNSKTLVNNPKYLLDWYLNKPTRTEPWL